MSSDAQMQATVAEDRGAQANGTVRAASRPVLFTLFRRELWEHRPLWIAPSVVAVLLLASAFFAIIRLPGVHTSQGPAVINLQVYGALQWATALPQLLIMIIVVNFYLLDCLYAERKDRSILFWKSLPVSDGLTVASKLLMALLLVPLGVFVLTAVTNLLIIGVLQMRSVLRPLAGAVSQWDTLMWVKQELMILVVVLMSALWYAPIAAWLALLSAWARRSVMLWTILPPLLLMYIEWYVLGSLHLYHFLQYRTVGIWQVMHLDSAIESAATLRAGPDSALAGDFASLHLGSALSNIDLWLGLAAACALAWLAARVRRYRDDT